MDYVFLDFGFKKIENKSKNCKTIMKQVIKIAKTSITAFFSDTKTNNLYDGLFALFLLLAHFKIYENCKVLHVYGYKFFILKLIFSIFIFGLLVNMLKVNQYLVYISQVIIRRFFRISIYYILLWAFLDRFQFLAGFNFSSSDIKSLREFNLFFAVFFLGLAFCSFRRFLLVKIDWNHMLFGLDGIKKSVFKCFDMFESTVKNNINWVICLLLTFLSRPKIISIVSC